MPTWIRTLNGVAEPMYSVWITRDDGYSVDFIIRFPPDRHLAQQKFLMVPRYLLKGWGTWIW